ncbi:MAG: phosphate ABC transporter substrate-binding protein [Dehalococcoidales bacterium]|nr:phosphate ABC transporter substrate-binding protein [Dehalococcoidales bacterium]
MLSACDRLPEANIVLAGSTSVQPFAEILAEEYMTLYPDISIDIEGGGSAAGILAVQSGTADVGMSSRTLKGDETKLWWVEIAKDGLAVVVHPDNPVRNLTLDQVRDIYTAIISDWSQIGGAKSEIHIFTREEGSGTRSAFESLVMGKVEITPRAMVQDSNGAVRQLVSDDAAAIGFISLGLVNDQVKAIALGSVAATRENVANGTYTLTRPFLFVARNEPTGSTRQFIDFTLSAEGREILNEEGLVTTVEGRP